MAETKRRYPKEVFAQRGDAIYESVVQPTLKPEDDGKFVAIDIETSEFEIDKNEMKAGDRLHARLPAAQIWMVRVGSPFVRRFGGRGLRGTLRFLATCKPTKQLFDSKCEATNIGSRKSRRSSILVTLGF